ncbi:MAG: 30S ribosomal protein S6 [Firmicutes bacterium]|nr:30S ribosomal protein S6 [Bacillota bacterium]
MRPYEAMVVLDPGLGEEELEATLNRLTGAVSGQGGEVTHVDRWGKRRLAYEIAGRTEGIYVLIKFRGEPGVAAELERVMRITDSVMRHLVVREIPPRAKARKAAGPAPGADSAAAPVGEASGAADGEAAGAPAEG